MSAEDGTEDYTDVSYKYSLSAIQLSRAAYPDAIVRGIHDTVKATLYRNGARAGSVRIHWEVEIGEPSEASETEVTTWMPMTPLPPKARRVSCVGRGRKPKGSA